MAVKVVSKSVDHTKVSLVSAGLSGVSVAFIGIANSALWIGGSDLDIDQNGNVVNGVNVPLGTLSFAFPLASGDTLYGIVPTAAGGPYNYSFMTYAGSIL